VSSADLIELAKQNPASVEKYTIPQIVGICGDGNLRDNSECSKHLREFLALQSPDRLADYARFCLDQSFNRSGFVLQDIVNEIGRRLGYEVENGRYQGVVNQVGFDGLWFDGLHHILMEVKTTDAYRINLDTVSAYAEKLNSENSGPKREFSFLIVVGRQDTGDLEAQVRGSRHAWSTRLISIEALIKLMFTKVEVDDKALIERIRRILLPFEYTRVDNIVDLVFETQQETEQKAQTSAELEADEGEVKIGSPDAGAWKFTPSAELETKRTQVVNAFFKLKGAVPIKRSRTNFSDQMNKVGITCAISKKYHRDYQPYWYALHPKWLEFMRSMTESYFVLGCMDRDEAYALPLSIIEQNLSALSTTNTGTKEYWHVALAIDQGALSLNLSSIGQKINLLPYAFKLPAGSLSGAQ
jgi:hypothetical protein